MSQEQIFNEESLLIMMFTVIAGILIYAMLGTVLFKIARKEGRKNAFLAWIPLGNLWLLTSLAEVSKIAIIIMLAAMFLTPFLGLISYIIFYGVILYLLYMVSDKYDCGILWFILGTLPLLAVFNISNSFYYLQVGTTLLLYAIGCFKLYKAVDNVDKAKRVIVTKAYNSKKKK